MVFVAIFLPILSKGHSLDFRIGNGITLTKLIPAQARPSSFRFGLMEGVYVSPSIAYSLNKHSFLTLEYNAQMNQVGFKHQVHEPEQGLVFNYKQQFSYFLHNVSVGIEGRIPAFHHRVYVGGIVKMGIAYGKFSGDGRSLGYDNTDKSKFGIIRYQNSTIPPDNGFWIPTADAGFFVSTNSRKAIKDRLSFMFAVKATTGKIFSQPVQYQYKLENSVYQKEGNVSINGSPLTFQCGINLRLMNIRK